MTLLTILKTVRTHTLKLIKSKYFVLVCALCIAFVAGRISVARKQAAVQTQTETKTVVRYVEKKRNDDADIDVKVQKPQLTVRVNDKTQKIVKADNEKYLFDKNKLSLEQTSKYMINIKVPRSKYALGLGASENGAAMLVCGPAAGQTDWWVYADKKVKAAGVMFRL